MQISHDTCSDTLFISGSTAQPWAIGDFSLESISVTLVGYGNSSSSNISKYNWQGSINALTSSGEPLKGAYAVSVAFRSDVYTITFSSIPY